MQSPLLKVGAEQPSSHEELVEERAHIARLQPDKAEVDLPLDTSMTILQVSARSDDKVS